MTFLNGIRKRRLIAKETSIANCDTLQAVVSPGRTLRYEGMETTASIRLLL